MKTNPTISNRNLYWDSIDRINNKRSFADILMGSSRKILKALHYVF